MYYNNTSEDKKQLQSWGEESFLEG